MKPDSHAHRFLTPPDCSLHPGAFCLPETEHVRIDGAPAWMGGLRALFVSDVHLRPSVSDGKLHALIERIRSTHASLLLLGGDYAETPEQCARFFRALSACDFPLGAYAVPGNNDPQETEVLAEMMAPSKVMLLKNRRTQIHLKGNRLEIAGCDDHKYGSPRTEGLFSDRAGYRILLSHFPAKPDCACDLMLSGHTHAGQLNLLGLTPYSIGFERRFHHLAIRGLHRFGGMRLLVGSGVGVSRLPLRIGASPRIYLLEFGSCAAHQNPEHF